MSGSSNALVAPRGLEEGRVEQLVDRLVGRRGSPEDALLRRFLIGCDLIAFLAVVFSVPQAALRGEWLGAVVVAVFGIALLILASLVRFAIALPLVVWVHFLTSSAFFFFISIQSDELRAEQLAWLVLLPLCAVATTRTARRHRFAFTVTKATILAVVVGGAIVAANAAGLTFHQKVERDHWGALGDWVPLLFSVAAMVWLFDRLLQRAEAELEALQVLLSVCAWCHKIQDRGNWVPVARYMRDQGKPVTHAICPSCTEKHQLQAP